MAGSAPNVCVSFARSMAYRSPLASKPAEKRAPLERGMCFEKANVTPVLEVGPVLSLYK